MLFVTKSPIRSQPGIKKDVGSDHVTNPRQGAIHMTYYHAVACSVILCM